MRNTGPDRRWLRTPWQIAVDRLTTTLFVVLAMMTIGIVLRLGPAEAMSRIAGAF